MIDLSELRVAIQTMTRQQALYRLIRDELSKQGHWKQKKRGKPNPLFKKK